MFRKVCLAGIGISIFTKTVNCAIESILRMEHPKTGDIVLLLADNHINKKYLECGKKHDTLSRDQQKEIIDSIISIEELGYTVHALIEDKEEILNGMIPLQISPLLGLTTLCRERMIKVDNIECRPLGESSPSIEGIDPEFLKRLKSYYTNGLQEGDVYSEFVDALAIQYIREDLGSVKLVVAGGAHTSVISKILYNDGYMNVSGIPPNNLNHIQCMKNFCEFDNDIVYHNITYYYPESLIHLENLRKLRLHIPYIEGNLVGLMTVRYLFDYYNPFLL